MHLRVLHLVLSHHDVPVLDQRLSLLSLHGVCELRKVNVLALAQAHDPLKHLVLDLRGNLLRVNYILVYALRR